MLGPIRDSLFLSLVLSFDSRVKNLASPRKKGISRSFVPRKMQISASRAESDTCYNGTGTGNSARKMLHTHIYREKRVKKEGTTERRENRAAVRAHVARTKVVQRARVLRRLHVETRDIYARVASEIIQYRKDIYLGESAAAGS